MLTDTQIQTGQLLIYARERSGKRWGFEQSYVTHSESDTASVLRMVRRLHELGTRRFPAFQICVIKTDPQAWPPRRLTLQEMGRLNVMLSLPEGA